MAQFSSGDDKTEAVPPVHISVCICTFRRPVLLRRCLEKLVEQQTQARYSFSIVIVDNDRSRSVEGVVNDFASRSPVPVTYCVEPEQNIAKARNRAVSHAHGDFIAFIDDDEYPTDKWLLNLLTACQTNPVQGVLGPVKPAYESETPAWIERGGFYDRPSYPTGLIIDWRKGRTGNVLLKRAIFEGLHEPFDPAFGSGAEDQDFFRRMIEQGHRFMWCHEALAYEVVPLVRCRRKFLLKRALLRGKTSLNHATFGPGDVVKSIVALPAYTVLLPFLLCGGQHHFMKYLIKVCDHLGRLLACVGIYPIKEMYVTE